MYKVSLEFVILTHQKLIDQTGGRHGIRDINLIESAIDRAFVTFDGEELHKNTKDKVVATTFSLINNHGFIDGNKRIGIAIMLFLLKLNSYILQYSQKELIIIGNSIAEGSMDEVDIKQWINIHME